MIKDFQKKFFVSFRKQGFALLFSVLVSSLLLTIGLSIFSITLKEMAISKANQLSVQAFYAADSGLECIKYWDEKRGQIPSSFFKAVSTPGTINCGNSGSIQVTGNFDGATPLVSTKVQVDIPKMFITAGDQNFEVTFTKEIFNRGLQSQYLKTTISSVGHDSDSGDRVERKIEQVIKGSVNVAPVGPACVYDNPAWGICMPAGTKSRTLTATNQPCTGNATMTDSQSCSIVWQTQAQETIQTWDNAQSYCASIGWRTPTVNETIAGGLTWDAWGNPWGFHDTSFWTSESGDWSYCHDCGYDVHVRYFTNQITEWAVKGNSYTTKCVR